MPPCLIAPLMDSLARIASAAWSLLFSALAVAVRPRQTAPCVSLEGVGRRCTCDGWRVVLPVRVGTYEAEADADTSF